MPYKIKVIDMKKILSLFLVAGILVLGVCISGCTSNENFNKYEVGDIVAASEYSPLGYLIVDYSSGLDKYEGYKFYNYGGEWGFIRNDDDYLIYDREGVEENFPYVVDHIDISNAEDAWKYPTHNVQL